MIPDYLASAIVSPRFYRASALLGPASEVTSSASLGMPTSLTAADLAEAGLPEASCMIGRETLSMEAAVKTINETVAKLGG